jgi:GT2 family glycosyltransferase
MALEKLEKRYSFLDYDGKPININNRKVVDQYGKLYSYPAKDLTSIILISAERANDTKNCIKSIIENTKAPIEIIISDVGSSDETRKILKELEQNIPCVTVIYNKQSTGTTGQRNQGIYVSCGEFIAFLDNDVLVLPGWLENLKKTMQSNDKIGLVGAKLLKDDPNFVYYCGIHAVTLENPAGDIYGIGLDKEGEKANLLRNSQLANSSGEVPWYTTTTLLAKRNIIFEIGGFDDLGIFIANEDKDLSLNVRKAGYKIYYESTAETIHNHNYQKVNRQDKYHSAYRLKMEQIEKDTNYFMQKWHLKYMIEKLPHEDNTKIWEGGKLQPAKIDFNIPPFKNDLVHILSS